MLDPFGGSGTTGIASLNLDRKFVMIERESKYIEVMRDRFSKFELFNEIEFKKCDSCYCLSCSCL